MEDRKSQKPDLSVKAQVRYVLEILEALGVSIFHCVGHDMGGSSSIMAINSENVLCMFLIDSVGLDYWQATPIARRAQGQFSNPH